MDLGLSAYHSFAFNAQIGGITMWNRYFGLQYYYNLDLIADETLNQSNSLFDSKGILTTSTFNADAVLNVYRGESFGLGFLLGFGVGFDVSHYSMEFKNTLINNAVAYNSYSTAISFDMRANLGIRAIFQENYALSLNCSIPFFANLIDASSAIKDDVTFSVRFTYGRF